MRRVLLPVGDVDNALQSVIKGSCKRLIKNARRLLRNAVKIRKLDSKKALPSISADGRALLTFLVSCCAYLAGRTMTCPS